MLRRFFCFVLLWSLVAASVAEARSALADSVATGDSVLRIRRHTWLFGLGAMNTLDTYLSPLEYTGPALSVTHLSERRTNWGSGRVSATTHYSLRGATLSSPTEDHDAVDGEFSFAHGFHYQFLSLPSFRLAVGAMIEAGAGFTYNNFGGNNPAQARLSADLAASVRADYRFSLLRRDALAAVRLDLPFVGACFTPHYGQSYYEIFGLGHSDRNVRLTHPLNAPSARLLATLSVALRRTTITVGYQGEARQRDIAGIKQHGWHNGLVVGFTRRIAVLAP